MYLEKVINKLKSHLKKADLKKYKVIFITPKKPNVNIWALDGGNSIILDGGSWFVEKIRVGIVKFDNKISESRGDFYLACIKTKNGIIIESEPEEIKIQGEFEEIQNKARVYIELAFLNKLVEKADKGDIILWDGSFSIKEFNIKPLLLSARKKEVNLVGFSKTSRIGDIRPYTGIFSNIKGSWYYLLEKKELYNTYLAKLHKNSEYVFRVDLVGKEEIFNYLAWLSKDPEILGYPYLLLRCDKIARIGENEKRHENLYASTLIREYFSDLKSVDLHEKMNQTAYK